MIEDKKLLSAFIYGAYTGGFCAHCMDKNEKTIFLLNLKNFLKGNIDFPKERIINSRGMIGRMDFSKIRDYIYTDHYQNTIKGIELEFQKPFSEIVGPRKIFLADECSTSFYRVKRVGEDTITGEHTFKKTIKPLKRLEGLEVPKIGEIVSAHWDHMMEIPPKKELPKYLETNQKYFEFLKNSQ